MLVNTRHLYRSIQYHLPLTNRRQLPLLILHLKNRLTENVSHLVHDLYIKMWSLPFLSYCKHLTNSVCLSVCLSLFAIGSVFQSAGDRRREGERRRRKSTWSMTRFSWSIVLLLYFQLNLLSTLHVLARRFSFSLSLSLLWSLFFIICCLYQYSPTLVRQQVEWNYRTDDVSDLRADHWTSQPRNDWLIFITELFANEMTSTFLLAIPHILIL